LQDKGQEQGILHHIGKTTDMHVGGMPVELAGAKADIGF
jgi:hypothetical protein